MAKAIHARYENGVLKPLEKLSRRGRGGKDNFS